MAEADDRLPPIEIPWKLAATTQPLTSGEPAQTALTLFTFEPDDATLTSQFPDDRLVFVKFTATISPASFPAELSRVAASFLGEGIPCMHLLLDLRVRAADDQTGTIRPYFHAASPLQRRMVQTGVVGVDSYEGEAEGLAIGKSGTQISETLRSHSNTSSSSASAGLTTLSPIPLLPGLLSVGGSVRSTSTDVASDRAVSQSVDTTARQASEERRDLVSHTTRVENIISLLSTRYVGTPHLSFSLSPQPLTQLSVDPADPNLWFQQLMARRSSGLEGIQEFTALVVVPRGTDFCIGARLRRVCLLDSPPGPFTVERFKGNDFVQLSRIVNYLNNTFPAGTPLDDLDVDIVGAITGTGPFRRPVVELWALQPLELVQAFVVSPGTTPGAVTRGRANYKHILEAWLDTLRDEYERAAARSPLERGLLFGENRLLDVCFTSPPEGGLVVSGSNASVSPLFRVDLRPSQFDIGGIRTATGAQNGSVRSRALETITRWNIVERQLSTLLASGSPAAEAPLTAGDPRLTSVMLDIWRRLPPDDARNVDADAAIGLLKLSDAQGKLLKAAGATRLSDIAALISDAPEVERQNADVQRLRTVLQKERTKGALPELLKASVAAKDSDSMRASIAAALAGGRSKGGRG